MSETIPAPAPTPADLHLRRYVTVSVCIAVAALIVVAINLLDLGSARLSIGLSLAVIGVQAALVLGFMMHLFSEKRLIYSLLAFTGFFLVFLLLLTIWAMHEVPEKPVRSATPSAVAAP
jgi:heme/copper-type cytochrome/quinol oxidase subunit 4